MLENGVFPLQILTQNALIKKKMIPVKLVNWYLQTGISRQPLQLLPQ